MLVTIRTRTAKFKIGIKAYVYLLIYWKDINSSKTKTNNITDKITILGVGGAGTNIVNNLSNKLGNDKFEFIFINTEKPSVENSELYTLQKGKKTCNDIDSAVNEKINHEYICSFNARSLFTK